ncbi:MAG: substrate-binding domain-containing protein [Candidatus Limnocylindria bacterium]
MLSIALAACGPADRRSDGPVRLGVTTTVQDSGLLDALVADFERRSGRKVRASVQGTGAVLSLARRGDVDVVLVHEPAQELEFMRDGYGAQRVLVMYNDFVLVGPPGDPARVKGRTIVDAFRAIAESGATFISRGDRSGTDVTEKSIWARVGLRTRPPWYVESGVGQGQSLVVASERRGYMITDRGTFVGRSATLDLVIVVEPLPRLPNVYHSITLDPTKVPAADRVAADSFVAYLLSPGGQQLIGGFGRDRFGTPLFIPAAGLAEGSLP